jgi:hypothetical protein
MPRDVDLERGIRVLRDDTLVVGEVQQAVIVAENGLWLVRRMATRAWGIATILLVNDDDHRKRPKRHAHEQRSVVDDQLRRASAFVAAVDEIEVPEDAVQRERNRQAEQVRCRTASVVSGLMV